MVFAALCLLVSVKEWKINLSVIDQNGEEFILFDEFKTSIMQLPNLREHYREEEIGQPSQAAFQPFDTKRTNLWRRRSMSR